MCSRKLLPLLKKRLPDWFNMFLYGVVIGLICLICFYYVILNFHWLTLSQSQAVGEPSCGRASLQSDAVPMS